MKQYTFALLAASSLALAASAQADTLYNWSFTTTAGVVDGSGQLTVNTTTPTTSSDGLYTGYLVNSFSGTYAGQAINSLSPVGTYYADNLLLNLTGTAEQLDGDGITFTFGKNSTLENLWVPDSTDSHYLGAYGTGLSDLETENGNYGTFVATPVATPEPSMIGLTGIGGAALLFQFRRRK